MRSIPTIIHTADIFNTDSARTAIAEFVAQRFANATEICYVLKEADSDEPSLSFYDENGLELWLPTEEGGNEEGELPLIMLGLDCLPMFILGFEIMTIAEARNYGVFDDDVQLAA